MWTKEEIAAFADAEEKCVCKHCGRCVLAGPPCCYDKLYEMYQEAQSQVTWLRKIQSKKDKKIQALQQELLKFQSPGK